MKTVSTFIQQHINDIIDSNNTIGFKIWVEIYNTENDSVKIYPYIVDKLEIVQSFKENFLDKVLLYVKLHPKDIYYLIKHIECLRCNLVIKYVDIKTGKINYDIPFIIKEYNLHIPNLEDLYKSIPKDVLIPKTQDNKNLPDPKLPDQANITIPVTLQLLEPDIYSIRRKRINIIFQRSNIKNVVLFICKKFNLSNVYYEKEINEITYQNIYIPVECGKIDIIFEYLQHKYGIYPNGLTYYYYDDVFYIYQPYLVDVDLEEVQLPIVKIFRTPIKSFLGIDNTYKIENNDLSIISNNELYHVSKSITNLENIGNIDIFYKSDKIFRNRILNGEIVKIDYNTDNIGISDNINRVIKNYITINYNTGIMNRYMKLSEIAERTTELVILSWDNSKPFSIYPGSFVQLIYEKDKEPIYQQGRIEYIDYIFTRHPQKLEHTFSFTCNSTLKLRLSTSFKKINE